MARYEVVYTTDPKCPRCLKSPCACRKAVPDAPLEGQTAKVRLEKGGRGGKVVTVVFNLAGAPERMKSLLKELQKACGTGGTVKADGVEVQGDHRDRVEARLKELGLKVKRAGG